jgi:hypothetical protein
MNAQEREMNSSPWFSFDPKLSWDGLLTFVGGLLAFFAILHQVHHADKGLRQQLESEKKAREQEELKQKRAVAVAMLFELDNFYRAYVRGLADEIPCKPGEVGGRHYVGSPFLPPLRRVPSDPFPIYKANGSLVGKLPPNLTALVVRAYSNAQWVLDRVVDYQVVRKESLDHGNAGPYFEFAKRALEEMIEVYRGAEVTLSEAMQELCKFADVRFETPLIAVAELGKIAEPRSNSSSLAAREVAK